MISLTSCWRGGSVDMRPGYYVQFRYNKQVVDNLKAIIPSEDREWRPEQKIWWVADGYEEKLMKLFANFRSLVYDQAKMDLGIV